MAKALDVALYLIRLAADEREPDLLSHLRLQKLLYYAQGWHLGIFGRPLFPTCIEAWTNGPVVRELFSRFADYKNAVIPPEDVSDPVGLSEAERVFIRSVWDRYKDLSASGLLRKSHDEPPWQQARGGLPDNVKSDAEITQESMRAYFALRVEEEKAGGEPFSPVPPARVYEAIDQFDRGGGSPHAEVFARLRNQ